MKKYKLTEETKVINGHTLHRIEALKDFGTVKKGELGGWIETEDNLSQYCNCWVDDEAMVYDANNEMANQWFKIEQFSLSDAFLLILSDDLDVAALESLDRDSYSNMDFIAFYDGIHYYIQKTTKSSYIKKKRLSFDGNTVNYQSEDSVIFI